MRINFREFLWFPITLLVLLGVYAYGFGNPPVFDDGLLVDGTLFAEHGHLQQIRPRMLSYGSFVWLRDLFGDGWWKQRLANLLIHVGVTLAIWGFYRDLLKYIAPSDDAAALSERTAPPYWQSPALGLAVGFFALNPAAVYAVAYLIQRSILLATLFVVLGLWLFVRAVSERRWGWAALALLCYLLAVVSKEHAVMAPLAAVPLYILVARPGVRKLAQIATLGGLLIGAVGALLYLNYGEIIGKPFDQFSRIYLAQLAALGPNVEQQAYPLSIINQAYLFFLYGLHWFFPYTGWMSIDMRPPFPVTLSAFPQALGVLGYAAVILVGTYLLIRYRDWRALIGVSLLLPAILFVTEFTTVWVQDPFVLYRSYLWAIGVPGLVFFLFHGASPKLLLPVGLLIATLFAWQGLDRIQSMSSRERLWADAIAKQPDDPRAVGRWFPYLSLGNIYLEQNRYAEAVQNFRASAALGDKGMGMFDVAAVLFLAKKYPEALAAIDEAERQGYDFPGLNYQRGVVLRALDRLPEAYREFQIAMSLKPKSRQRVETLAIKGKTALQLGDVDAAVHDLEKALRTDPRHKDARLALGMAYVIKGEHARARDLLTELLAEGDNGPVYYGRALANYGLKQKAAALSDIEQSIRLGPDNPNLHAWQAKIRAMP